MAVWMEKYRPESWSTLVGQEHVKGELKNIDLSNLTHILFVGKPGIGKTTVAYIIARECLGENWKHGTMTLNASDERGIDTIRNKVKEFCKSAPISGNRRICFLDEADFLTTEAQHALRRVMEDYAKSTLFILSANYESKIIPALKSRVKIFRFNPLSNEDMMKMLKLIKEQEKINAGDDVLQKIINISEGDLRKSINEFQSLSNKELITLDDVTEKVTVDSMFDSIMAGRFLQAKFECEKILDHWEARELLVKLMKYILKTNEVEGKIKGKMILELAETDYRLVMGSNPTLQTSRMILNMIKIVKGVD